MRQVRDNDSLVRCLFINSVIYCRVWRARLTRQHVGLRVPPRKQFLFLFPCFSFSNELGAERSGRYRANFSICQHQSRDALCHRPHGPCRPRAPPGRPAGRRSKRLLLSSSPFHQPVASIQIVLGRTMEGPKERGAKYRSAKGETSGEDASSLFGVWKFCMQICRF